MEVTEVFDHRQYLPILRWKRAERVAVRELRPQERQRITPLIELVPSDFDSSNSLRNAGKVLVNKATEIEEDWGTTPIFVDLLHLDPSLRLSTGQHPVEALADAMSERHLQMIPVTGLRRDGAYQVAIAAVVERFGRRICLRIHPDDIKGKNFSERILETCDRFNIQPKEAHLLIDSQATVNSSDDMRLLFSRVPHLNEWLTFTYASGAFPQDLSMFTVGQHLHPRTDFISWSEYSKAGSIRRLATFGDYTIQHGRFREPPPSPNISASIRYTHEFNWIIMRGEGLRNKGGPGHAQYPANAQLLCSRSEYCGAAFSYGDNYIYERSQNTAKPGTPETWLRAGVNHHITFTVQQVSKLF
jgi:hypothetical protein